MKNYYSIARKHSNEPYRIIVSKGNKREIIEKSLRELGYMIPKTIPEETLIRYKDEGKYKFLKKHLSLPESVWDLIERVELDR